MAGRDPERYRQWKRENYARNREKIRAQQREYYARNREKILEQMSAYRAREGGREANRQYQREWYQRNRQRIRAWGAEYRHGLRPEDWAAMWAAQDGRCYLCGDELDAERTHVDHDHSCCGKRKSCPVCRRGLACPDCNAAIGYAHDEPGRLRRIADALEAAQRAVEDRQATETQAVALF